MSKKSILKFVIQTAISILTALGTVLGVSGAM